MAYHKIKKNIYIYINKYIITISIKGINEANEIVHKFLNREQTYSQLLNTIADYEKRIEDLKK